MPLSLLPKHIKRNGLSQRGIENIGDNMNRSITVYDNENVKNILVLWHKR